MKIQIRFKIHSDPFVAQICCSDWLLRLLAQICCSDLLIHSKSLLRCCSDLLLRLVALQNGCSDLLFRFVAQIGCSDYVLIFFA